MKTVNLTYAGHVEPYDNEWFEMSVHQVLSDDPIIMDEERQLVDDIKWSKDQKKCFNVRYGGRDLGRYFVTSMNMACYREGVIDYTFAIRQDAPSPLERRFWNDLLDHERGI